VGVPENISSGAVAKFLRGDPDDFPFHMNIGVITTTMLKRDTKDIRVVIDSRTRNQQTHPSPAAYEVSLPDDLHTVHSARLLYAQMPFSSYAVPAGEAQNVTVVVQTAPTPAQATTATGTLPSGDFETGAQVAAALQGALNGIGIVVTDGSNIDRQQTFAVSHDAVRVAFNIRSTHTFAFDTTRLTSVATTARLLGFPSNSAGATYASTLADDGTIFKHFLATPYRRCTDPRPYIVMRMQGCDTLNSPSPAAHRAFAIIPRTNPSIAFDDLYPFKKSWTPPLARVSRIRVAFTDPDGMPYDFQNQDHRIDILFTVSTTRSVWSD
jgi:hypothetical protein